MTNTPLRRIGAVTLLALDALAGVLIGGIAVMFGALALAGTGYGWLFGLALAFVIVSTGVADRILMPKRDPAPAAPSRAIRRAATWLGLAIGAVFALFRLDLLPPGGTP